MNPNKRDHTKTPRALHDKNLIATIALEGSTRGEIAENLLTPKHDHIKKSTKNSIFSTMIVDETLYTGNTKMVLVDREAYEKKYANMIEKGNEIKLFLDTVRVFDSQITKERKEYLRLINDYNEFITKKVYGREKKMNEYKHYPTDKVRVDTRVFAEEDMYLTNTLLTINIHTKYMNKILDINNITIDHS